jgi:hypothetical protein
MDSEEHERTANANPYVLANLHVLQDAQLCCTAMEL